MPTCVAFLDYRGSGALVKGGVRSQLPAIETLFNTLSDDGGCLEYRVKALQVATVEQMQIQNRRAAKKADALGLSQLPIAEAKAESVKNPRQAALLIFQSARIEHARLVYGEHFPLDPFLSEAQSDEMLIAAAREVAPERIAWEHGLPYLQAAPWYQALDDQTQKAIAEETSMAAD